MPKKNASAQKLLPRKPRVQIEYDVEIGDSVRQVELPWVTGVMADLSGANSDQLGSLSDRKFTEVDRENFGDYMKKQAPKLQFSSDNLLTGEGKVGVDVTLESMEDFNPDNFARKIGSCITEVVLTEEGTGDEKKYVFDPENEASQLFGESVSSLDDLTLQFVAYKIGEKEVDIEVSVENYTPTNEQHTLRYVKKGPLAKLLDARGRLKELLLRVDGKDDVQKVLEGILEDKDALQGLLKDED